MSDAATKSMRTKSRYESDFFAWTQEQGERLRRRAHNDVDWENVAEEIETLGRTERSEIASRLHVLLVHLLKWQFQPEARSYGWKGTIVEQRVRLRRALRDSPSLKTYPSEVLDEEYASARLKAAGETGQVLTTFPASCPYSVAEVIESDAFPAGDDVAEA